MFTLSKLYLQLENSRGEVKLDAGIRVNFNVVDDGDNLKPVYGWVESCFVSRSLYGHIAYVHTDTEY